MDKLGVAVYYSDPQTLAAIPDAVERLGVLFGTEAQAGPCLLYTSHLARVPDNSPVQIHERPRCA